MPKRGGIMLRLDRFYEDKFRAICKENKRSLKSQIEWWIDQELEDARERLKGGHSLAAEGKPKGHDISKD
jgi:hypothetical protein